jgi:hypothetical protein
VLQNQPLHCAAAAVLAVALDAAALPASEPRCLYVSAYELLLTWLLLLLLYR